MTPTVGALVLAAGKGTRMYSEEPKVLRTLLGEHMLGYVLDSLRTGFDGRVHVVVGFRADSVRKAYPQYAERFVLQEQQLGTGHALQCAWSDLTAAGYEYVLVVNGDVPLATADDLDGFVARARAEEADVAFLTIQLPDPGAYGRVVRHASGHAAIVEAKDFDEAVHGPATGEINAGIYLLRIAAIEHVLFSLSNANRGGELYITDLAGLVAENGGRVLPVCRGRDANLLGINNARELVAAEEALRSRIVDGWLDRGVVIRQSGSVRIGPHVSIAPGCEICGPCDILGETVLQAGAVVESHCHVTNCRIGPRSVLRAFTHAESADLAQDCQAGPYARLRPGAVMRDGSRVGNFVEMKKAELGVGAKAGHLTYLGDAEIGPGVNVGAGTITCNYDGKNKFKTVVKAGAFIGSNSALVAPVTIGENALVGAGSVITMDVPDNSLALGRGRQVNKRR